MISLYVSPASNLVQRMVDFKVWMIKNGIDFSLIEVDPKEDPEGFKNACQGVERLIIVGGIGTVNAVVNASRSLGISYGYIPGCDCNDLSRAFGFYGIDDEKLFNIAVKRIATDVDTWVVNGELVFLSSLTFGAQTFADKFHCKGDDPAYLSLLKEPYTSPVFRVRADNGNIDASMSILSVQSAATVAGGLKMDPLAKIDDGILDVVCVQKPNFLRAIFNKRALEGDGIATQSNTLVLKTSKVRIESNVPEVCIIDGIGYKFNKVEILPSDKVKFAKCN